MKERGEGQKRKQMTRIQLILIRLLLLALVLGAWETLPRNGVINPLLLPPFSDVLTTLCDILGRPQVHEAILVTAAEVIVAFVIAVPLGAAIGVAIAESDYFGADLQAAALLRVQRAEIDLPADVHPHHGHRLPAEGRLRGVLDAVHRHHERDRGG